MRVAVALALAGCAATATPAGDAGSDASDASPDCAAALLRLDDLRVSARSCNAGDTCAAQVVDFCCPLEVQSSASDAAQAFRMAFDDYRRQGCPLTLCSAKPCTVMPACIAGACAQP